MLNSAGTAAQMEQDIWPHHSPTQARTPAHGSIRIGDIQHTLLDEVHNLTLQRNLETVRDMPDHFLSDMIGFLPIEA